ncbi:testis-expressed protein 264 isoform X1 [Sparus aurata]|uniref:Testis expressed 264, ER-phagy receptor n=1 Tax=Sparus aurata TaxID=8175 RepID=A0A671XMZ0_SPAAU|nr:testis-expressed protein 264-like isoform X1 [Sparus aurata]
MAAWLVSGLSVGVVSMVIITVSYFLYSGLLADVTVATGPPPIKKVITFAYKYRKGPYRNCWKLFLETSKIGPELSPIAVFYDDPGKVPQLQNRYIVGSILSEGENEVDEEVQKRYETKGYKVYSFPFPEITHMVIASFPNRTLLSAFLRLIKVYRPLIRYMKENTTTPAYPIIEIYTDDLIHIMAPMNQHLRLCVPEVLQEVFHSGTDI